jgi:Ca2+-binding RTX toxin-like protein
MWAVLKRHGRHARWATPIALGLIATTVAWIAAGHALAAVSSGANNERARRSAASSPLCNGMTPTIVGTDGNDVLTGTPGDDVIDGLGGNDVIHGGAGNDSICGGPGNDIISGQVGADTLIGGPGDDTLLPGGDRDDDHAYGYAGVDTVSYADATFQISANLKTGIVLGQGTDRLTGIENIDGSAFNDVVNGSEGVNQIRGRRGDDSLGGNAGDDVIDGGAGNDTINGNNGDDLIDGGAGNDRCIQGHGTGTLVNCESIPPARSL